MKRRCAIYLRQKRLQKMTFFSFLSCKCNVGNALPFRFLRLLRLMMVVYCPATLNRIWCTISHHGNCLLLCTRWFCILDMVSLCVGNCTCYHTFIIQSHDLETEWSQSYPVYFVLYYFGFSFFVLVCSWSDCSCTDFGLVYSLFVFVVVSQVSYAVFFAVGFFTAFG